MGGVGIVANSSPSYPGKLTSYVVLTMMAGAAGGLIFGYDLGISGGVTSMAPFLEKFFPEVYKKEMEDTGTNQYCKFDSQILQLFTSSLYLAALGASVVAAPLTKKYGRRITMMMAGFIFLIGAGLTGGAVHLLMLIGGRILLGVGVGFANQSVPLYLSEMAPYNYRGMFNILFQLMITIGILCANVINYLTAEISGGWGWRVSLGLAGVPALIILVASFFLSDTPNSLVERGMEDEAKTLLKRIRGVDDVEAEFDDMIQARNEARLVKHPWRNLMRRRCYRPQLAMSILIPFFQQFTGINVIMFYAPVLFKTLGFGGSASLMSAIITGAVNMFATGVSIYGSDRWGRRSLFLEGGIQMLIFQLTQSFHQTGCDSSLNRLQIRYHRKRNRNTNLVRVRGGDVHMHLRGGIRVVVGPTRLAVPQRDIPSGDPIGCAERHGGGEHVGDLCSRAVFPEHALRNEVWAIHLLRVLRGGDDGVLLLFHAGDEEYSDRGDDAGLEESLVLEEIHE
ncbi:hypothetical protein DH2020_012530 [Rehmannia glutinosa]|uniref:Major facilitator superfamily (MFS) profile domain-containing protein n=1 Tax=Rehmannia glutinosa TaxID=99300 RepID=A0ABR0X128_REHGL